MIMMPFSYLLNYLALSNYTTNTLVGAAQGTQAPGLSLGIVSAEALDGGGEAPQCQNSLSFCIIYVFDQFIEFVISYLY